MAFLVLFFGKMLRSREDLLTQYKEVRGAPLQIAHLEGGIMDGRRSNQVDL
jgi:hypothetical protein